MIFEKKQELMNEYRQLSKKFQKAINDALDVVGTDEFYPAIQKAEDINLRLNKISSMMKIWNEVHRALLIGA